MINQYLKTIKQKTLYKKNFNLAIIKMSQWFKIHRKNYHNMMIFAINNKTK